MMDSDNAKDFASLLHAYSLGCLEREDFDRMREYFKSNQDYAWQELGEYQNLVALLPSFLNLEVPDVQVKDRVARKLYRLRDQQRPQRATQIIPPGEQVQHKNLFQRIETPEQKLFSQISSPTENKFVEPEAPQETFEPIIPEVPKVDEFEPVSSEPAEYSHKSEVASPDDTDYSSPFKSDETPKEEDPFASYSSSSNLTDESAYKSNFDQIESGKKETFEDKEEYSFESSLSNYSLSRESSPKTEEEFSSFTAETIIEEPHDVAESASETPAETPQVVVKKSGVSAGLFFFFVLILAGAIGGVYYYLSKDFKVVTEQQATKYEKVVQSLQNDLASNKEVDELLASINLQMVNLKSTPKAAGAYGKLLFDSVTRKAIVQVVNLPVLSSDKVYQLWALSNNQKYASGMYNVTSSTQYFPVTNFSGLNLVGTTTFIITEEIASGGEKPSGDVYLVGQFLF